ncbi:MAG: tryptophan synthase subunit alpha [Candidatus Obscuribacterales bacterium]|nr:tryptophan synthase subunit alpha [Candidatus Obscuribacterales bacterium]
MISRDRYRARFRALKESSKGAFMPFTVLGWPDEETSFKIIKTMIDNDASALELGIAFSDPVADGPIIQAAAHQVIESGYTVDQALDLVARVRKYNDDIPIGLLVYYNHIMAMGVEKFYARAGECGVDGVLVADLPAECSDEIVSIATSNNISTIFIVSPLTREERLEKIVKHARGFIYLVSRLGVTGTDERDASRDSRLTALIASIKKATDLPVLAGFGISTPVHAERMMVAGADGVITGSKIVDLVTKANPEKIESELSAYLKEMVAALNSVKV